VRPVEHFLSRIDKFERRRGAVPEDPAAAEQLIRDFIGLIAPAIGKDAAGSLAGALMNQPAGEGRFLRLGYAAAFLLGEFDSTMELDAGAWEEIRAALEDASGEMDLTVLTALMGELLSRGKL
jgi:hypothetical protein